MKNSILVFNMKQGISRLHTKNIFDGMFYCCAWSNIRSAQNALKSGFMPAWVEMTVKPAAMVEKMNQSDAE